MNLIEFQNSLIPGDILEFIKHTGYETEKEYSFIGFKNCGWKAVFTCKECFKTCCKGELLLKNLDDDHVVDYCGIYGFDIEKDLKFKKVILEEFITEEEFSV